MAISSNKIILVKYIRFTNKFEIIENRDIKEKLKLNGKKWVEELHAFYQNIQIGIEYLAFLRVDVKFSSTLKEKEYFAMGLLIIGGSPDKSTPNNCKYRHIFPSNKTIINIEKILNFAEIVY
mgnify:CR=1 FL=1